ATQPIVSTTTTTGLSVGSVVRLTNKAGAARQFDIYGHDFVVGAVSAGASFTLLTATNPLANTPGMAGTDGFYQIVYYPPLFYPARKTVVNIVLATSTVSTAVEHSYTVGQAVRFNIPAISGTVELNPSPRNNYVYSTITSITDAYNFVVDTNMTSFTAFVWPKSADQTTSFPTVEPIGMNTANGLLATSNIVPQFQGLNINNANSGVFADATVNTGYYGMILGTGGLGSILAGATKITGPAGTANSDVMYWIAGKSDFGGL
ncbi:MAG: hypothetical protein ACRDL7_00530, partial [Gaiellaceae bacterium]